MAIILASLSASDSLFVSLLDAIAGRRWMRSVLTLCRAASEHDAFLALNDVVRRGLFIGGTPSMLEHPDLDHGKEMRPDEISVTILKPPLFHPGSNVRQHLCIYESDTSRARRLDVADAAEVRKNAKYAVLGRRFTLQPLAAMTCGAMGKSTIKNF